MATPFKRAVAASCSKLQQVAAFLAIAIAIAIAYNHRQCALFSALS